MRAGDNPAEELLVVCCLNGAFVVRDNRDRPRRGMRAGDNPAEEVLLVEGSNLKLDAMN